MERSLSRGQCRRGATPPAARCFLVSLCGEPRHTLIGKGLDAGPHTIAWHLEHHHQFVVSVGSIRCHLHAAGLVTPGPQKRPKSSYIRCAAEQPYQRWQADSPTGG